MYSAVARRLPSVVLFSALSMRKYSTKTYVCHIYTYLVLATPLPNLDGPWASGHQCGLISSVKKDKKRSSKKTGPLCFLVKQ